MTRVVLTRHARSTWNESGRWQGQRDPPLSPHGRATADAARATVPPEVVAVVSSDLRRAAETAARLAPHLPSRAEPLLRERRAGPWEGLTHAEIDARWPEARAQGRHPDGWEDDDVLAGRLLAALARIAAEHPGATVLAVSHGGAIAALLVRLGHPAPGLANLERRVLHHEGDGRWRVEPVPGTPP